MSKCCEEVLIDELTRIQAKYTDKIEKLVQKRIKEDENLYIEYQGTKYRSEDDILNAYGWGLISDKRRKILTTLLDQKLEEEKNSSESKTIYEITEALDEFIGICKQKMKEKQV